MLYKIGDFAKIANASIRTLRYYDEINLFKPKEIDLFTSYRYYSNEQIEDYNLIKKLQDVGFSLEEIKENWNHFTNELMLEKKNQLLKEIENYNEKVKEIEKLRSKIVNGKITNKEFKERDKIKTIFN